MHLLVKLVINGIAVYVSASLLAGVQIKDFLSAIVTAIVLGGANLIVKPILVLLTLPINILTLGLFTLAINALMVLLVDALIVGFQVQSFLWAMLFSLTLSLVSSIINRITRDV